MPRLSMTPNNEASTKILEGIKKSFGNVPNIFKIMSNSSNVLEGYIAFSSCLAKGILSEQDREQIALAVSGFNKCQYCASAHSFLAKQAGVSIEETERNIKGKSKSPRTASLMKFCYAVLSKRGEVSDDDVAAIRSAGFNDEGIVEIIGNIAVTVFTNYFNLTAKTVVDFFKVDVN